jgi:hypothetical protein
MTVEDQHKIAAEQQFDGPITPSYFEPITSTQRDHWMPRSSHVGVLSALVLLGGVLWYLLTATAVFFDTTPDDASVEIDSALVVKLSDSHLMHSGTYPIKVNAEGYFTLDTTINISDVDSQRFPITLEKKPGTLILTSTPQGALINIDNTDVDTITPATLTDLTPGVHILLLNAARHFPQTIEVNIEGLDRTQALHVDFVPAWGVLTVASQPQGAKVFVDNELRGTTPLTTELLQGGEAVKIQLDGYKPWQRILRVDAGSKLAVDDIQLEPMDAVLHLSSKPNGAGIIVNGTFMGRTPLDLPLAPNTAHRISLFLDGFHTAKRNVRLKELSDQTLQIPLLAETGKLRVQTKPTGAEVLIDGVVKGRGGQTF